MTRPNLTRYDANQYEHLKTNHMQHVRWRLICSTVDGLDGLAVYVNERRRGVDVNT